MDEFERLSLCTCAGLRSAMPVIMHHIDCQLRVIAERLEDSILLWAVDLPFNK